MYKMSRFCLYGTKILHVLKVAIKKGTKLQIQWSKWKGSSLKGIGGVWARYIMLRNILLKVLILIFFVTLKLSKMSN